MNKDLKDKKYEIYTEFNEIMPEEELMRTLDRLDQCEVPAPSEQSTEALIAMLKPIFAEEHVVSAAVKRRVYEQEYDRSSPVLQLIKPQCMLLSKWFIILSLLSLFIGLFMTNAFDGDTLRFLANASPLLGILTVLYEFRAQHSNMQELEAACPYSPAQIAAARLLIVLGYDILLCLLATSVIGYWHDGILWRVVISWLAPLLFVLGVALCASLKLGISGGCLVSSIAWILQWKSGKGSMLAYFLPNYPLFIDCASLMIGIGLIFYAYKRWNDRWLVMQNNSGD